MNSRVHLPFPACTMNDYLMCSTKTWKVPLFECYYISQMVFVYNRDINEDQTTFYEKLWFFIGFTNFFLQLYILTVLQGVSIIFTHVLLRENNAIIFKKGSWGKVVWVKILIIVCKVYFIPSFLLIVFKVANNSETDYIAENLFPCIIILRFTGTTQ